MKNSHQLIPSVKLIHPEWSKNATIYQINTRQFTQEGTFQAAEKHLPRLKELGVDILWLMPIHEIGKKNRKGSLGSPYAVKDYYSVNSEFGTLEDLKQFIRAAHQLDMRVILDWVANHTAWDNLLVEEHPEWYHRDWKGEFHPSPWRDWDDIIDLDYQQPALREYMIEALKYWVRDVDVDGYRCDVAGFLPTDFWNQARRELDAIKPVFMLAEWESRDLHVEAFDMTYGWSWYDTMHAIAMGRANLDPLFTYYSHNEKEYPADVMRMLFVTNHDKNSWEGTMHEAFGDALEAVIALSFTSEGMPMMYNGQEAGEPRRLAFFEKDPITWTEHPIGSLYKRLLAMRKKNTSLWNAKWGARMTQVVNSAPTQVLSFVRQNNSDKVFAVFNFSAKAQSVTFKDTLFHGNYVDFISDKNVLMNETIHLDLAPWEYHIFIK
ncbi:MAG: alpha-glucosidase C-terminal domain-containing protein [Anaerolineales bacterium]|jgi:glycosidase|nr:alpha-glucosidase C-terminal domain-containing protein [Anaerolineales bacterium]